MWNLNYAMDVIKDNPHVVKAPEDVVKDVVKETGDVVKARANVTKEFVKAQRQIYKLISQTPQINATQMSENMGISLRLVQRYLKQLSDLNLIVIEGGRKNGFWKILDEEYEGFFKRIWRNIRKNERNTKFNWKENPHNSLSYADLSIYTFR